MTTPANDNRSRNRISLYGLNAYAVAAMIYGIGLPTIVALSVFGVAFLGLARLGERR